MSNPNGQGRLLPELLAFLEPIVQGASDPAAAYALINSLGWNGSALFGSAPNPFITALTDVAAAVSAVERFVATPPKSFADIETVLAAVKNVVEAIGTIQHVFAARLPAQQVASLAEDLIQTLALKYLSRRVPVAVDLLRMLTLVRAEDRAAIVDGAVMVRESLSVERLELDRIPQLLSDPVKTLRDYFAPNGLMTDADAAITAQRAFPLVCHLLTALGAQALYGRGSSLPYLDAESEASFSRMITVAWQPGDEAAALDLGLTARLLSGQEQGPGLLLVPFGSGMFEVGLQNWRIGVSLGAMGGQLAVTPAGIIVDRGDVELKAGVAVGYAGTSTSPVRFGNAAGTRLEAASLSLGIQSSFQHSGNSDRVDYGAIVNIEGAKLVIAAGSDDGFLGKFLPASGVEIHFDIGLDWSKSSGLHFHGGGGTDTTLTIKKTLFDILTLESINLALSFDATHPAIQGSAALNLSLNIGPVLATVEKIGVGVTMTFPATGGNLGPVELDLGFKPPTGIGLRIDAGALKGGGFLSFDIARQQYSGVLQLSIQNTIDIKAIGLLNAKLPDNRPGFSLLLIITGEFPPIQLGMGFTLNGVGGLLGINRTTAIDVLRGGVRNGTLDSILFPPDPLHDVTALLHTVSTVFPVAEGRFVFGPMVRIGWGSPTVLTLDVAVLIELPDPVRIILLGRLKLALPDGKKPVAVIRMDAVGVLDFGRQELSLDASIYDSRLLTFTLAGDMAMRLSWGEHSSFLLSIGGFHPHFPAPAGIPALGRIAIVLIDSDKDGIVARVRLDAYIALTSNTVQFGSHLQAYFKALGVEIQGLLGFDALIHFPFSIEAELAAAVTLSFNGVMLMGADVTLTLTGPHPWHLVGEARFVFLGIKIRAPIEIGAGDAAADNAALPPPADLAKLLLDALQDARNWHPALPPGTEAIAGARPTAGGDDSALLVHPLATLSVRQRLAPLGVKLNRFGNALLLDGASSFALKLQLPDAKAAPLQEAFAMAQFQVLSDDEKLSRPSFELAAAGLQFTSGDAFAFDADAVFVAPTPGFEEGLAAGVSPLFAARSAVPAAIDPHAQLHTKKAAALAEAHRQAYVHSRSAPAQAVMRRQGKARYTPADGQSESRSTR